MSSPKAASAKTARRPAGATQAAAKRVPTPPAAKPAADGASADAKRLAAEIERALAGGQRDLLSDEALQALMAAVCKVYGARVEAGEQLLPLPERGGATATDVMVTASGLLKSANLAVFELGMWQSWTGR
ncbi:MAG: hypothetical protein QOE78_2175 [Alphaproteobacteria bacterium]|jgi:hypothetical protein|nr:hypothetical protein [Alphaproteobacteria bacterium]